MSPYCCNAGVHVKAWFAPLDESDKTGNLALRSVPAPLAGLVCDLSEAVCMRERVDQDCAQHAFMGCRDERSFSLCGAVYRNEGWAHWLRIRSLRYYKRLHNQVLQVSADLARIA